MLKKLVFLLLVGLILSGCGLRATQEPNTPTPTVTATFTQPPPTETPRPTLTATVTPTPTPDFSVVGLPAEPAGTLAFDFVKQLCQAQWFTEAGDLSCPGDEVPAGTAFVEKLSGDVQGLPANIGMLLTFPPPYGDETISSKYPPFLVEKGDRFRTVLACRAHTFCDVEFILNIFDDQGQTRLAHWTYLFADPPIVVDYSLEKIAGKTVQFGLSVQATVNQADANAVWIAPHIYRPLN
jgi:hypothetical protein